MDKIDRPSGVKQMMANTRAPRNTEEQLVRIRLDALIRQTWCALRDLSDYRDGGALTKEDMDLWGQITPHPAIQRVLDRALANSMIDVTSPPVTKPTSETQEG